MGDPYSHVRTASWACLHKMKPVTNDYQLALRHAMLRFGRPTRLSLDHDSAFYDNKSASPYPSRLPLWTIALSIEVVFIHKGRPTEHGFIERPHQVVDGQALLGRRIRRSRRHPAGLGTAAGLPERAVSPPGFDRSAAFGSLPDHSPFRAALPRPNARS